MSTKSSSAMVATVQPKSEIQGVISKTVTYNSGSTIISDSATTIEMMKIPHGATVLDVIWDHTHGAATCPADVGISSGNLSTFATAIAKGAVAHATKPGGVPYTVSKSDDAINQFDIINITPTPTSASTSFITNMTVLYTMDK